ncbi:nickel transporter permease [Lysinibacillus telephonicus]|uniref:ABC transporter permease subunit n=1 Tax=Lysinibacillus telephonicus TaxID=1714840 RepID=A0A3S0KDH1_9BACI|nr:nickel transporter permease [Lysinibacillus telephonicus]RTQ88852.1 ABC transporter permease subunit [Lysinibacillus telephonicus]
MLKRLKQVNIGLLVGLVILLSISLLGLFAPWIAPHDPLAVNLAARLQSPSWTYPFGTDHLGRCILSRIIYGIRISATSALIIMFFTMLISVPIALLTGYVRGRSDNFMMRIIDSTLAIPDIVLTIAIVGLLGPGLVNMIFAIVVVRWASYVRFIRSLVIKISQEDYIFSARMAGNSHFRILKRYILPQIAMPILVFSALDLGKIVLNIASLSFLGLGSQPPTPEWGAMLNDATDYFQISPYVMFFPGLAIVLFVLSCQLVSERLGKHDITFSKEV